MKPLGDITNRKHDISGRAIETRKKVGIFYEIHSIY